MKFIWIVVLLFGVVMAADDDRPVKVYSLKNGTSVVAVQTAIMVSDGKSSYTVTNPAGKNVSFDASQITKISEQPLSRFKAPELPRAQNFGARERDLSWLSPEMGGFIWIGNPWGFETLVLGPNGLSPLGSIRSGVPSITNDSPVIGLRHDPDGDDHHHRRENWNGSNADPVIGQRPSVPSNGIQQPSIGRIPTVPAGPDPTGIHSGPIHYHPPVPIADPILHLPVKGDPPIYHHTESPTITAPVYNAPSSLPTISEPNLGGGAGGVYSGRR